MSEWSYENYKGFQLGKWSDSKHFFVLKDCDINNPIIKGLENADECRTYIDSLKALEELNDELERTRKEDFVKLEIGSSLMEVVPDAEDNGDGTYSFGGYDNYYYVLVSRDLKLYIVPCNKEGSTYNDLDFSKLKDIASEGLKENINWLNQNRILIQERGKIYA